MLYGIESDETEKNSIKIHARVTKEISITPDQQERLINHLCGCVEHSNIDDIIQEFTAGITSGDYDDAGYIPSAWLEADFNNQIQASENLDYLLSNQCKVKDIDL